MRVAEGDTTNRRRHRAAWAAGLAVVLLAAAAWAWNSRPLRLKDRFIPRKLEVVEPGAIYRSGQIDASLVKQVLVDQGIRVIVDLQAPREPDVEVDRQAELAAAKELGIRHESHPLAGDGTGDVEVLAAAVASVARARREGLPVLVHCSAGSRRTGSVLFAYLLLVERRPASEAERELVRFLDAEEVAPQRRFLDEHLAELRRELEEAHVIESKAATGGP